MYFSTDKIREVKAGHDGTWVAHPDLVKVALDVFDSHMPGANQLFVQTPLVNITAANLLDTNFPGSITDAGLSANAEISLLYTQAWLNGNGCVPIHNLMEDAATAEISRSQLFQWVAHGVCTREGTRITRPVVEAAIDAAVSRLGGTAKYGSAAAKIKGMVEFCPEFLTSECYADIVDAGVDVKGVGAVGKCKL